MSEFRKKPTGVQMIPSPFADPHPSNETESVKELALQVLKRHGYTAGDLDFLLYEGQGGTPGDDDPDLERAIGVLGSLRERGESIR